MLLAFYDYPAEHWIHLRTTNPIESTFATVRPRNKVTKGAGSRAAGLAMVFKLIESAGPGSNAELWSSAATWQPERFRMIAVYGTSAHEPAELGQLIAERLGIRFTKRESDYRGIYLVARLGEARIEIQPNAIPGDDGQSDLYADEHPGTPVLVLVTGPDQDGALNTGLAAIDRLSILEIRCT